MSRPEATERGPRPRLLLAAVTAVAVLAWTACSPVSQPAAQPDRPDDRAEDWSDFNIKDVFPEGAGRDLVLDNCQSCHVLAPILVLPMDESAWYRSGLEHRERVEGLSDGEFETLYKYLTSNFKPGMPKPKLPPALLDTWTTY